MTFRGSIPASPSAARKRVTRSGLIEILSP
jgi:hypothetical protein